MSAGQMNISTSGFLLMQEKIETQKGENKILRQKLQSKAEALIILSQELDKVRNECEDYRELTRRLQTQWSLLSSDLGGPSHLSLFRDSASNSKISELREENKRLVTEREHLRKVLSDREDDIKLIRRQWLRAKNDTNGHVAIDQKSFSDIIKRLETLQIKYGNLKRDFQSLLDEKVDLIQERDAYKCKVHRLNHSLAALLKSDGYKSLDVDSLLSENRFLRETLEHTKEEKELANEMGKRYKKALEKTKLKENATSKEQIVDSEMKEILSLIQQTSFACPVDLDLNSPHSLRELSTCLLETLNERMLQLKHQRRANKHLMERIAQVETKFAESTGNPDAGELILWPSQYLMKNYSSLSVDKDSIDESKNLLSRQSSLATTVDRSSPDISDLQHKTFVPPDIIATDFHRQPSQSVSDDGTLIDPDDEELPKHLQQLVDQAMAQMNEAAEEK
jgi:hypothetical protein